MIRFLLLGFRSKRILLTALLLATFHITRAQELKLGNNPTVINKASLLELESTTRGLLLPRIPDTTAAPLPTAPDGMVIYFTADSSLYVRKGGAWQKVVDKRYLTGLPISTYWLYGGNAVTAAQNLGTTSAFALPIITNNTERMRVASNGRVGIATSSPTDTLTVAGPFRMGANGTRLNGILKNNVTTSAVNILTNGGNANFTLAFANAAVGATVAVSPLTVLPDGIIVAFAYVPSAGNVYIRLTNANVNLLGLPTTTAVGAITFAVTVTQ